MEVKLHRFILPEFNTYRVWSRNSASSRAIPTRTLLTRVKEDPAVPLFWGKNRQGMSATEELSPKDIERAIGMWLDARNEAVMAAEQLLKFGLHKQVVNRLLEPWMWQTIIVTATEWDNAFWQRCHDAAQPEFRFAAMEMQYAIYTSTPKRLEYGEWHLPYITEADRAEADTLTLQKVTTARCARVSYLTHDGVRDLQKDVDLFTKLTSEVPMHGSPLEHVATPHQLGDVRDRTTANFIGWKQYRQMVETGDRKLGTFIPNHPALLSK
jgi:hypothetical protein